MRNRKFPLFMYFVIGIAVIGLLSLLIKNPSSFLITIFTTVIIAFVIFLIVNAFMNRRTHGPRGTNDEMKKYRQAVRQSKQKYGQGNTHKQFSSTPRKETSKPRTRRRRPTHLRVIEGQKSTATTKKDDDLASN